MNLIHIESPHSCLKYEQKANIRPEDIDNVIGHLKLQQAEIREVQAKEAKEEKEKDIQETRQRVRERQRARKSQDDKEQEGEDE